MATKNSREKINKVLDAYKEVKSGWRDWRREAAEDFAFKMGNQWDPEDMQACLDKGVPALSINHILKNINLISGYQRQNKSDIRVLPIEGSDEYTAEVLSRVIKWCMTDRNADFTTSDTFKDALICGIGWLHPFLSRDYDIINGDIRIVKPSPFDILPDPYFTERDLSDCDYIIRHRLVSAEKLERINPNMKNTIRKLAGNAIDDDEFYQTPTVASDRGKKVLVLEYWYRDYEERTVLVNSQNEDDVRPWDGKKDELKEFLSANKHIVAINREYPKTKLITVYGDSEIAYDGDNPFNCDDFPFIPIMCFYESSVADWKYKLHGLVRPLKDIQREKNKRRSQLLAAVNTMPNSGWIVEKNAVDDVDVLSEAAGSGKIIEVNPNRKPPEQIQQPPIPMAIVQMETMFDNDLRIVGANPDMLGEINERGAPGIAIQLRQKQGVTSAQEVFDSLSFSLRILGRRMIHYIVTNFNEAKIKRILGDDYTFGKQIKELLDMMKQVSMQQIQIPEMAPDITPEDETAYNLASDEAKRVLEEQKMADQAQTKINLYNVQMAERDRQLIMIKSQIEKVQADEKAFWDSFDDLRENARFDCAVDETVSSATYRTSILAALSQVLQYTQDPTVLDMMIEFFDIPKAKKDAWLASRERMKMLQQSAAPAAPMAPAAGPEIQG